MYKTLYTLDSIMLPFTRDLQSAPLLLWTYPTPLRVRSAKAESASDPGTGCMTANNVLPVGERTVGGRTYLVIQGGEEGEKREEEK